MKKTTGGFLSASMCLLSLAVIFFIGCENKEPQTAKQEIRGITIVAISEEMPRFKREYSAKLDKRCSIKVTIYEWSLGIAKQGELTQPNGKWILFDPDAIADKIIDPILVPLVQKAVDDIFILDKDFRNAKPAEFTDETGVRWKRL